MVKEVPAYRINSILSGSKGFTLSGEALNGGFRPGRDGLHWPSLKTVKLKECQPLAGDTYQLKIKGLKQSQIREGDLILPGDWDGGRCKKALFYCPLGAEYARDPGRTLTTLIKDPLVKRKIKVRFTFTGCLARAEFSEPVFGIKGGFYRFLRIDEPLMMVARGEVSRADAAFAGKALSSWKDQEDLFREFLAMELGLRGYALRPREYDHLTLPRTEKGTGVLIRTARYKSVSAKLRKKASAMGGTADSQIRDPLEGHVRDFMIERGDLVRKGHWLLLPGADRENALSPMARGQLNLLKEKGGSMNPAESKDRGARENWEAMGRMGLIRYHEGLIMTGERYGSESDAIVNGLKEKGPSELAVIRGFSGLTRREILILLEWMEKDGLLENRGDVREAVL